MTTALEAAMARSEVAIANEDARRSAEWPKFITLTGAQFDSINTREWGIPTGTTIGRQWKAPCKDGSWNIATFTRVLPMPTCCRYHRCIAGEVNDTECHRVAHDLGGPNEYTYDPRYPEEWTRRTGERGHQMVEIKWSKIICPERIKAQIPTAVATSTPRDLTTLETSLL